MVRTIWWTRCPIPASCFLLHPPSSHSFSQSVQTLIYLKGLRWLLPRNNSRKKGRSLAMTSVTCVTDIFNGTKVKVAAELAFPPGCAGWSLTGRPSFCLCLPAHVGIGCIFFGFCDLCVSMIRTQLENLLQNCSLQEKGCVFSHGVT